MENIKLIVVGLLGGCLLVGGCFPSRTVRDVTNSESMFRKGEVYQFEKDAVTNGSAISVFASLDRGSNLPAKLVDVEEYKSNPSAFPVWQVFPAGTRVRIDSVNSVNQITHTDVHFAATVLNGDYSGRQLFLEGSGDLFLGSLFQGDLRANPDWLRRVESNQ